MMYTRRSHKKSRFGCKKCKARKTKCDEVHPICGNCRRHKVQCDFAPPQDDRPPRPQVKIDPLKKWLKPDDSSRRGLSPLSSSRSSTPSLLSNTSSRTGSTSNPSSQLSLSGDSPQFSEAGVQYFPAPVPLGTPTDRLLELKLFHHYFEMTSSTPGSPLTGSPLTEIPKIHPGKHVWAVWMTGLAFHNQSLMDALLGFSAFHLRYLNPLDREMSKVSHKYMLRALSGHAQDIRGGLNETNAEAVFATSTFVAFHAGMSQKFFTGSMARIPPLHWFRPYQGIRAVLEAGWEWIRKSSVEPLLQGGLKYLSNPISLPEQRQQLGVTELPFDFLLEGLFLEEHDAETIEAYETAVIHLNTIGFSPNVSGVLRFPAVVSRRFVDMVGAQDPRTLAMVGYFFMLLKKVEKIWQVWWLQGTVDEEFKTLMDLLPKKWWPKMEWAISVFEGQRDEVLGI